MMTGMILSAGMPEQIDGVSSVIVITVAAIAVVCLQFFCCWKWQNWLFRLIPGVVDLGIMATFFMLMTRALDREIAEGYEACLEIFAIMFGAVLAGWLAWFLYVLAHNKFNGNPAGY